MTEPQNKNLHPIDTDKDEIDLIALAKTAWNSRKTIIKTIIIFTILGLFIAIFTPRQYSVTSIMVPQVSSGQNKLGGLSSLAAMAGFSMDMSTGSELSPMIYPQIVQSIPFQLELMQAKLNFEGYSEPISFYDYYTDPQYAKFNLLGFVKKFTIGLPGTIIALPGKIIGVIRGKSEVSENTLENDNAIIQLTAEENGLCKALGGMVYLNVEAKEGTVSLSAIMPEAKAAAQLGQIAQELLQEKITEYKIKKAEAQLEFVQDRYNEREKEFKAIQEKLAINKDRNKQILSAIDNTEQERLQSEYQISLSVFMELAKQLEKAKIQVKEETPVFSIIQPISVPSESFKPKRKQILFIWIFLGGVVGIAWVFGKHFLVDIKKRWVEEGIEKPKI